MRADHSFGYLAAYFGGGAGNRQAGWLAEPYRWSPSVVESVSTSGADLVILRIYPSRMLLLTLRSLASESISSASRAGASPVPDLQTPVGYPPAEQFAARVIQVQPEQEKGTNSRGLLFPTAVDG
jgi:hypothetical protein